MGSFGQTHPPYTAFNLQNVKKSGKSKTWKGICAGVLAGLQNQWGL